MTRALIFAALIAWSSMAGAVVYKWVDAKGHVQYGDQPPDGVHAEVVEIPGSHAAAAPPPPPADSAKAADKDSATKQAVADDVAQTREKQCSDAQDRYKKLIEGRRLYKTGEDGQRQYLSSEEIDTERLNAKQALDEICNSKT